MLLDNQWVKEEIKGEIKNYLETNENENIPKLVGCSKNSSKRKVHSNKWPAQETKVSVKDLTLQLKELELGEQSPKLEGSKKY